MLDINYITGTIGIPATLEQLAEEASELSKAALKLARIRRNENPTPVSEEHALESLLEEYNDVIVCAHVLDLPEDIERIQAKQKRWIERIEEEEIK